MKILVIIVTFNAMKWANRCLESLRESSIVPDVFVVDNGSTDGTQEYIKKYYPRVMFQQSKDNIGFGKANNIGLQYALDNGYDYVYLMNQDAWIFPNTLEVLMSVSKNYPDYGIISPFQMEANMEHIDSSFKKNTCNWSSSPELLDDLYLNKEKDVIKVSFVMAAHCLITRNCLNKVGGFSPTFPHYGEDNNYEYRAEFHGYKIGVVPQLQVVHDRGNRKDTKKMEMYFGYVSNLNRISNPLIDLKKAWIDSFIFSFRYFFKFKTITPIVDMIKIFYKYREIKNNRKQSIIKDCAFLNNCKHSI